MIHRCDATHQERLLAFLREQPLQNTFLLSDIEMYGFDKSFQTVWLEDNPARPAVYLLFYDNLAVFARQPGHIDNAHVTRIVQEYSPSCVMGQMPLLQPLALRGYRLQHKVLCAMLSPLEAQADSAIVRAGEADAADIHRFLNSFHEFDGMYASLEMIAGRTKSRHGVHLLMREAGQILCHGNTAASSYLAMMFGGVGTHPDHRCKGYAHRMVVQLCCRIQALEKTPCTLCTPEYFASFYQKMGFDFLCDWGMMISGGGKNE